MARGRGTLESSYCFSMSGIQHDKVVYLMMEGMEGMEGEEGMEGMEGEGRGGCEDMCTASSLVRAYPPSLDPHWTHIHLH